MLEPLNCLRNPSDYDLNVRLAELRGWTFVTTSDPDNCFGIAYFSNPPGQDSLPGNLHKQKTPPDFVTLNGRAAVAAEIRSHGIEVTGEGLA